MKDIYIETKHISKQFSIYTKKNTSLRALKSFIKGETIKREKVVLKNMSFRINAGENVAIVGKNGSGKTTLLRVLSRIYSLAAGSVEMKGRLNVLFKFWIGFNHDLSVIDNIYLYGVLQGIKYDFLKEKSDEILNQAGLYELRFCPLKELSGGQQQRLALTIFFYNTGDILMFDECVAILDKGFSNKIDSYFRSIADSQRIMIMTSHDGDLLKKYCQRAIWIENGSIYMDSNIDDVMEKYERSIN